MLSMHSLAREVAAARADGRPDRKGAPAPVREEEEGHGGREGGPEALPEVRINLSKAEERRRVAEAIDALAEPARLALALRYYESIRVSRIAGILDLPEEDVRRILAEAVDFVLRRLHEEKETRREAAAGPARRRSSGRKAAGR